MIRQAAGADPGAVSAGTDTLVRRAGIVVAAVSTVMEQAGDPLWSNYRTMATLFSGDVGAVLEEINA